MRLSPQMSVGGLTLCPPYAEGMWHMSADTTTTDANTNRWDTRQMVTMAILVALGTLTSFIDSPIEWHRQCGVWFEIVGTPTNTCNSTITVNGGATGFSLTGGADSGSRQLCD